MSSRTYKETESAISQSRFRRHGGALGVFERILLCSIPITGVITILDIFLYFGISVYVQQYLAVILGLVMTLVPLITPATKKSPRDRLPWYDAILSGIGFIVCLYVVLLYPRIVLTSGLTLLDRTILGTLAVLLILESCRRLLGWALVIIVALFILYAHFSDFFPGPLYGRGVSWIRLANYLYLDPNAMFGLPTRITCTIVFAFILFGQMLFKSGGGKFLSDGAMALMGRYRGGAAKASVVGSSAFGAISGSAVANVVTTGFFTIPLMKKMGFRPHVAGAIEATASTGGQIMPPVMGVTAFLMAELLSIPYTKVVLAALVPGIIYYIGVFVQVDLMAAKNDLKGLSPETLPVFRKVLADGWIFIIPGLVLIYALFIMLEDPDISGLYAIVAVFVICMFKKASRINLNRLIAILEGSGEALIEIAIIAVAAGVMIGVMTISGLGFSFSLALAELAGENLFVLLLLAAFGAIVLGMGMPVLAAYILVAMLIAPALISMGMIPISAHMFVFYFAVLSFLTPPVCLAVYAAASLAGSEPISTAFQAVRLGIAAYIVPFVFSYSPELLLIGSPLNIFIAVTLAIFGIVILSIGVEGYLFRKLNWLQRVLAIASGFGLLSHGGLARGIGFVIAAGLLAYQVFEVKLIRSGGKNKKGNFDIHGPEIEME
jgi:TRAP transporter 4TM/12TM fusion protein